MVEKPMAEKTIKLRRIRKSCRAEVIFCHDEMTFNGRIEDLSEGGCYVDTINPLPEGAVIGFSFILPGSDPGRAIVGEGQVVWQKPFQGMGVRFIRMSDRDRDLLKGFVRGGSPS
jgi:hypothetical protein